MLAYIPAPLGSVMGHGSDGQPEVISTPRLTGPFGLRPLVLRRRHASTEGREATAWNWFII